MHPHKRILQVITTAGPRIKALKQKPFEVILSFSNNGIRVVEDNSSSVCRRKKKTMELLSRSRRIVYGGVLPFTTNHKREKAN